MEKRELVALLNLSSWCLVMVEWLFLVVQWVCLRFVIVVFPDRIHLLLLTLKLRIFSYSSILTFVSGSFEYPYNMFWLINTKIKVLITHAYLHDLGHRTTVYLAVMLVQTTVNSKVKQLSRHVISNNVICATYKASDQPAHTRSLIWAFASRLNIL